MGLTACSVPDAELSRLMAQEGVTKYTNRGYKLLSGCGDDPINTTFSGMKNGVYVEGVICAKLGKAYTIRYY